MDYSKLDMITTAIVLAVSIVAAYCTVHHYAMKNQNKKNKKNKR